MSMGPQNQAPKVEISTFDRIKHTVRKVTEAYFEKPLYYLFYSLLVATSIALLFNQELPIQYYILLFALAGIEFKRHTSGKAQSNAKPRNTKRL